MSAMGVTDVGDMGAAVPVVGVVCPAYTVGSAGAAAGCSGVMILGNCDPSVVGVSVVGVGAGVTGAGTTTSGWVAPMGVSGTLTGP